MSLKHFFFCIISPKKLNFANFTVFPFICVLRKQNFCAILLRLKQGLIFWKFEAQRPKNESGKKCSIWKLCLKQRLQLNPSLSTKLGKRRFSIKCFFRGENRHQADFLTKSFFVQFFLARSGFQKISDARICATVTSMNRLGRMMIQVLTSG